MSPRSDVAARSDEEDAVAPRRRNQNKKRNKKQKLLFAESGLTDEQRRTVRSEQRTIQESLRNQEMELDSARDNNNKIFKDRVCFTREAVLDADNVEMIAEQFAKEVEQTMQVPRFDAHKFVQKLSKKCSASTSKSSDASSYFDWSLLGTQCGVLFTSPPERVSFLRGALNDDMAVKAKVVRKPREKVVKEVIAEVVPESVVNNKSDSNKLSAMEKTMRVIKKKLTARTKEALDTQGASSTGQQPDLDGVQFLFNPNSFTQTVENIFNFSFLIKKGEAAIGVRDEAHGDGQTTGLYVAYRNHDQLDDAAKAPTSTQAVCSFTLRDWRRLCRARALEAGDIPHRSGAQASL